MERVVASEVAKELGGKRKLNIGVIGAGSWGTALADLLARNGHAVTLWVFEADLAERLRSQRENDLYLPGFPLAPALTFTADLQLATRGKQMLVLVPPSQVLRGVVGSAVAAIAVVLALWLAATTVGLRRPALPQWAVAAGAGPLGSHPGPAPPPPAPPLRPGPCAPRGASPGTECPASRS